VPYYQTGRGQTQAQRTSRWTELLEMIRALPVSDPHMMAFTRTVRQVRRLLNLDSQSAFDPLCQNCTSHIIGQYVGSEEDLLNLYHHNLTEINETMLNMRRRSIEQPRVSIA
jgi:hypothetical protein